MAIATVLKEVKGVYANDDSDADTTLQDLITDDVWRMRMILDAAAGTDYTYASLKVPYNIKILDVAICPGAALTADATDYNTWTLAKADGAGGAATAIATLASDVAGGDWVADVFKPMTLSGTAANLLVSDGQLITLKKVATNLGVATPASTCYVRFRKV